MPSVAFLVADPGRGHPANDNHVRLPQAFSACGWSVTRINHESLAMESRRVVARDLAGGAVPLSDFDLYFVLGFGPEATFLDRMQLLRTLDQDRFVNTVDALVYQHGKVSLFLAADDIPQPETHVGNDPDRLAAIAARGGDWIAKPPAASFGREVFRLREGDANRRAILEHLTRNNRYALLQAYIEPGAEGEKRTLVAAGKIIGTYGKRPRDHRGNLNAGADAFPTTLTPAEAATVGSLADRLDGLGVRFATIDLVGSLALEINVANPGWLATYDQITGVDLAPRVVEALTAWSRYGP
ncbi:MAG: hypothetical protein F4X98_17940 [Gammaproteobacteria bacterium]|nr:hypothetical protein [Gammaproteobacteria bacterium]